MPFSSVQSRFTITSYPNGSTFPADVTTALTTIYDGSPLAAHDIDVWLAANPTKNINIQYTPGAAQASLNLGVVQIDPQYFNNQYYISKTGKAVADSFLSGLAHELSHAVTTFPDNESYANLAGDNIKNVNKWYVELGIAEQATYEAYTTGGNVISPNQDYSQGNSITNAIIDLGLHSSYNNSLIYDTGMIDLALSGVVGSSVLIGSASANVYGGSASNDWIYGGGGNDTLSGGDGNDQIWGGVVNIDTNLTGEVDRADYSYLTKPITIKYDGSGSTLDLSVIDGYGSLDHLHSIEEIKGSTKRDVFQITGNIVANNQLKIDANGGQTGLADIVNLLGSTNINGLTVIINTDGTGSIKSTSQPSNKIDLAGFNTEIVGSNYKDTITDSSDGDKIIDGKAGDDNISTSGSSANVTLRGDTGTDTLTGGSGDDVIVGGTSNATLDNRIGNILNGGDGSDLILSSTYDHSFGGAGNDYIVATGGWFSGEFNGVYAEEGTRVDGGAGDDVIDYRNTTTGNDALVVLAADGGHDTMLADFATGNNHYNIQISAPGYSYYDLTFVWEAHGPFVGSYQRGDLAIVTPTGSSLLIRNATISSVDKDTWGMTLRDLTDVGGSSTRMYYDSPNWTNGSIAAYDFAEQAWADAVAQSPGSGTGGSGDDNLRGGAGNDILSGGGGDDNFAASYGQDTIDGGNGSDTFNIFGARSNIVVTGGGTGSFTITDTTGVEGVTQLTSVENIYFATDNETYAIEELGGYYGSSGADTLNGSERDSQIYGGAGNDILNGNGGNDQVYGQDGDDQVNGNAGNDTLNGGIGNDTLQGGAGSDYLDGDVGTDVAKFSGNISNYTIYRNIDGTIAVSDITNADGFDTLQNVEVLSFLGGVTLNVIDIPALGTSGNDTLVGSTRSDYLYGLDGNDSLSGGSGDDSLDGGQGIDTMIGGAGNDQYFVDNVSDIVTETGSDTADGVQTSISYTLGSTLENLFLAGGLVAIDGTGNASNNVISGNDANNVITGFGGNDTLLGAGGNDTFKVSGSADGFDFIDGGAGTDTLQAMVAGTVIGLTSIANIETVTANGLSGVSILGSSNADTLNFTSATLTGITAIDGGGGNDTITGSAAADTIIGSGGDDALLGGNGNDTFQYTGSANGFDALNGGAGTDTVAAIAASTVIGLTSLTAIEAISAGAFADVSIAGSSNDDILNFTGVTLTAIAKIDGGTGNDSIIGSAGADTILGSEGDDTLVAANGNDTFQYSNISNGFDSIDGGSGTDTISALANSTVIGLKSITGVETISAGTFAGVYIAGSANADTLSFASTTLTGITKIDGGAGNDSITGSSAADTIFGGDGLDTLTGGAGADLISGDLGDDVIFGGAANDTLSGGDGNDLFKVTGTGDGSDSFDGGLGSDTVQATAASTTIGITSLVNVEAISSGGFSGVSILATANADTLDFSSVTLTGITKIDGAAGNDTIIGSAVADTILGSGGDDSVSAGGGNDALQYTGTSNGFDAVDGGLGTDTISVLANSTVIGFSSITGVETISGGAFTGVYISGSANADTLNFSSTTLTAITKIDGGTGNDTITGSAAADTILGSGGDDSLLGGLGNDTFQYTGTASGFDAVDGGGGTDTIAALANSTVIGLSSLTGVETITGGAFTGVYISGSGNADTLDFSTVTLTAITKIQGGAGNDVITGSAGADTILGGTENDTLNGGSGNDSITGDDGDDRLVGGAGNDTLNGANGIDTVDYSYASAALTVSLAVTTAQTVATGDVDTISNIENLIGGSGADTITGSTANNSLSGGNGDDRITGGAGNDTIDGGAGTVDVAVFAGLQASYTITTVSGTTTIVDNQTTTDGNDGTDTLVGVEKAEFKGGVQVALAPPIVLDLDGDGVELVDRKKSKAKFDWDSDGKRDKTGWVGKDDGLLVFDRNGDGKVSGANELSFVDDKPGAKSDLDGLSAFDSNGDGIFSSADDKFASFRVWRDKDGDGKSDKGELMTLAQAGVASITLAGKAVNKSWGWNDNLVINTGSFTRTNGTTSALGDVALNYAGSAKQSRYAPAIAANRFAEALAAFRPQASDDITNGQHSQDLDRQPVFGLDSRTMI